MEKKILENRKKRKIGEGLDVGPPPFHLDFCARGVPPHRCHCLSFSHTDITVVISITDIIDPIAVGSRRIGFADPNSSHSSRGT